MNTLVKITKITASSTLTDEEIETQPEHWELKDLTPNVVEEEEEDFEYDDMGVKVKWNKETEGWDALEPYCVECGRPEGEVEVEHFTIENEVFICCECFKSEEEEN